MTRHNSQPHWLFFVMGATALFVALLVLERPYSTIALGALLAFGLAVGIRSARLPVRWARLWAWVENSRLAQWALRHRLLLTHGLAVGAVYLLVASAQAFQPRLDLSEEWLPLAGALFMLGGLARGGALWLARHGPDLTPLPVPGALTRTRFHARWLLVGAGGILLLILAEANGEFFDIALLESLATHVQFALLVGGLALIYAGLRGIGENAKDSTQRSLRGKEREVIKIKNFDSAPLLLCLFALSFFAFLMRVWDLENSVRFLVDELSFLSAVQGALLFPDSKLVQPVDNIAAFPRVITYFQAVGVSLFGHSFSGLRIASVLIGTLTVPVVYLFGKTLFDRKVALIAAALLATFPPHVHFSRLALTEAFSAFTGTLALALLARGLLENRQRDWVLGGLVLGLTHYFHEGGRLLYTPLALLWLCGLWLLYRGRVAWRGSLLALLVTLLVAAPVYYTLAGLEMPVMPRFVSPTVGLTETYWQELAGGARTDDYLRQQVLRPLLMYVNGLDSSLFYRGETSLLLPVVAPAFLLGVWYALWRWRAPGLLLLLLWVLATSFGNSLLEISTSAARYVVVYPALMVLAAVGIRYTAPLILPEREANQRLYWRVVGVLVVGLAVVQAAYYFNQHLPTYNRQIRQLWDSRDGQDVALRAARLAPGTRAHLISRDPLPDNYVRGLFGFMNMGRDVRLEVLAPQDLTPDYFERLPRNTDHAFFIAPDDTEALALVEQYFYLLPPQDSPYDDLPADAQFMMYRAPYLPGVRRP